MLQCKKSIKKARGGWKALVVRDIVRFVTAGTLTEEALLEGRSANRLAALARVGSEGEVAIAAADISTGRFEVISVACFVCVRPTHLECRGMGSVATNINCRS